MKKLCKQVKDQIVWNTELKGCFRMETNSKAFDISILTASGL